MPESASEQVEIVIAGAGAVGLAIARALALRGHEVWVLEAAGTVGSETSSRNSEVIHAGLYYPAGSLKARLCAEGRNRLYAYCAERSVAHRRLGKIIVATTAEEVSRLDIIRATAAANGVTDLELLDARQIAAREPALRAVAGLWSPSTGIIDSHGLIQAYHGDAEAAGAMIVCHAPIDGGSIEENGLFLDIGGAAPMRLRCKLLINAAGLGAVALAHRIDGFPKSSLPQARLCKGSYFTPARRPPFRHLIYPLPEPGGLGVHLTLDLAGQARFGPDVEWVETIDYAVDPTRAQLFYPAIRRYWPELEDDSLVPGYSGIRPKIVGPGAPAADFRIEAVMTEGIPRIVNLFGIESPGLTASLAIAEHVAMLVTGTGE